MLLDLVQFRSYVELPISATRCESILQSVHELEVGKSEQQCISATGSSHDARVEESRGTVRL